MDGTGDGTGLLIITENNPKDVVEHSLDVHILKIIKEKKKWKK